MRHRSGKWYASPYSVGWFFYMTHMENQLGPFKTFEDGLKEWNKQ